MSQWDRMNDDSQQKRREMSTTVGLVVLVVLAAIVIGRIVSIRAVEQRDRMDTLSLVARVAHAFQVNDKEQILKWARGEYQDTWGNGVVIVSNKDDDIRIGSKGPDGEFGTSDDIVSDRVVRGTPAWKQQLESEMVEVKRQAAEVKEETKSMMDGLRDKWNRWRSNQD